MKANNNPQSWVKNSVHLILLGAFGALAVACEAANPDMDGRGAHLQNIQRRHA